jgi:hypothetical protein
MNALVSNLIGCLASEYLSSADGALDLFRMLNLIRSVRLKPQ